MEGLEVVLTLAGGAIVRVKTGPIITGEDLQGHSNIVAAVVPEGVTTIGACAFYGCTSLASVTIPDGVTTIGQSAFEGCSSLVSVKTFYTTIYTTWSFAHTKKSESMPVVTL